VNVMVKGLEASGLIRRIRHPDHGRILLASLTVSGRRSLQRGRTVARAFQERVLSELTPSDRTRLARYLRAIERASGTDRLAE
jgi:DNA-binding MarR family transcriptional regulator